MVVDIIRNWKRWLTRWMQEQGQPVQEWEGLEDSGGRNSMTRDRERYRDREPTWLHLPDIDIRVTSITICTMEESEGRCT